MPNHSSVKAFLHGLDQHLSEDSKLSLSYATGASAVQLGLLKERYPYCPESLLELLSHINGTYWQQYGAHTVNVLILGSDVFEYPYYLKSVEQILEENNYGSSINEIYAGYINDMPDLVDKAIDAGLNLDRWLCFSDCMNNGGTSRLYIDFNPTKTGRQGQVVRYLHDPDSYEVIANSFDEYLQTLIYGNYSYISEED